jgi:hypothetical protein
MAIMEAIAEGDIATARWWAEREMRDRGFGQQVAHVDELPDPAQQMDLQGMVAFFHGEAMRRYRTGLGPLLIEARQEGDD